ncbi:peptide chain release factor 1 isoform X2 [Hetaerina americana]|uniref:peptide chain release factor 1 isoform X2 n=1 Tax=Hetaerina americana TaxID=62018 RepID=UPI003A7F2407
MNGISRKLPCYFKLYLQFCNGRKGNCIIQSCFRKESCYVVSVWNSLQKRNCSYTSESKITLENPDVQNYISSVVEEFKILQSKEDRTDVSDAQERIAELSNIVALINERKALVADADELKSMKEGSSDDELEGMVKEEMIAYQKRIKEIEDKIIENIVPSDPQESCGAVLEVSAGVGGKEAMLFSRELFDMYCNYATFRGWNVELALMDVNEMGGLRHSSALISGQGSVFGLLCNEAGVHRVQRIPITEKSGRMHTSTVRVAVLPQPTEVDICIKKDDLRIETKRASGAGGQHVNTTDSAVRITHLPSGISIDCQTDRSQHRNKEMAMQRLRAKLYETEKKKRDESTAVSRKEQIGDAARSEKIRTYNFNQDRITDHRIGYTEHGLEDFMQGKDSLDRLVISLYRKVKEEKLIQRYLMFSIKWPLVKQKLQGRA